jgi:cbb3-type cytochrome oxidase subunit 3
MPSPHPQPTAHPTAAPTDGHYHSNITFGLQCFLAILSVVLIAVVLYFVCNARKRHLEDLAKKDEEKEKEKEAATLMEMSLRVESKPSSELYNSFEEGVYAESSSSSSVDPTAIKIRVVG